MRRPFALGIASLRKPIPAWMACAAALFISSVVRAQVVELSKTSLTFSAQLVGTTSAAQNVTLTNTGSATLDITNIAASGDLAQTNTCGSTVGAGGHCTISVTFAPLVIGTLTGTVSITDNAPGSPQEISLTGTGTEVTLSPGKLTFVSQQVGVASQAQNVKLTNGGATALAITAITIGGANAGDFKESNTCGSGVPGGGSCTITVTFTPAKTGSRSSISVSDNGGGSPQKVTLAGAGATLQAQSLTVTISGLPTGTNAQVTVSGPGGYTETLTQTTTLTGLAAGSYTIPDQRRNIHIAGCSRYRRCGTLRSPRPICTMAVSRHSRRCHKNFIVFS